MHVSVFTAILLIFSAGHAHAFGRPSFDSIGERAYPIALKVVQKDASAPSVAVSSEAPSLSASVNSAPSRAVYNFSKDYVAYCGAALVSDRSCILRYIEKKHGKSIVDLQLMNDLNKQAEKIWNAQLQCNNGNLKNARENYRVGKFCSSELKEKFAELRMQVRSLAETSLTIDTFGLFVLKPIHSLITQMVLEENLAENYYADWRSDAKTGGAVARNHLFVKETMALIQQESTYDQEDANFKRALDAQKMNPLHQAIRRVLFYNAFLDLLDPHNCSQWGLWPKSTAVVLGFHGHVGIGDFSYWYDSGRMNRIQEKSKVACGRNSMQDLPDGSLMAFARVFAEIPKAQAEAE